MFGLSSKITAVFGALVGAVSVFGLYSIANTVWLLPNAREQGRSQYIAEQAVADQKAEMERKGDDAKIRGMSDYDLCIAALGRVPECEALKM